MSTPESSRISPAKLALAVRRLRADKPNLELIASDPIAIIGMGCRFPGDSTSPERLWEALREGRDGVGEIPSGRWKDSGALKPHMRRVGYLSEIDEFDAAYFGISPREAQQMDPQQRLLLEVTWEALWDAGIAPESIAGTAAGVFVAIYNNDYTRIHFRDASLPAAHAGIGTAHSVAAGRISFLLNLKGPSLAIDSACSSSLVAIHLACQSLRACECGMAIVGASSLKLLSHEVMVFSKWGMLASDGRCKTFDASADGFVPGEGSGVVILKRLSDALQDGDRVRAVIRGTAVNQDGKSTVLTAPNGLAQEAVLRAALSNAKLQPQEVSYIETHGTGTSLGDPIEIEAIQAVYGNADAESFDSRTPSCVLGAVKTNLGHLEAAAGLAGLIKTVLCLEHGEIPRNLHFHKLNSQISLDGSRLIIPTSNVLWGRSARPRLAGVSSFGIGGTNGHIIVEEAPLLPATSAGHSGRTIPLPAHVWQRQRFWLPEVSGSKRSTQDSQLRSGSEADSVHPLLGRPIDSAFVKGKLFESDLNTATAPYLVDHSLGDRVLVPFAVFLETAAEAIRQIGGSERVSIRDFVIREPLFVPSSSCRLQVLVEDGSVAIASSCGSGWTKHVKGSFRPMETEVSSVDLSGLRVRCNKEISQAVFYQTIERTGLHFGKAFRTIQSLWAGDSESLAFLRLSDDMLREASDYGMHPALLDGCLQTVIASKEESTSDLFLPIHVDCFELRRLGVKEFWVHTKITASSAEALSADIVVMDAGGDIVAHLTGFTVKRTSTRLAQGTAEKRAIGTAAPMYAFAWRSTPQGSTMPLSPSSFRAGERWLLIKICAGSQTELARSLAQQGAWCEVANGAASYRAALANGSWTGVVYDARGMQATAGETEWLHPEEKAVGFLLDFVKLLEASSMIAVPRLWVVTSCAVGLFPFEDVAVAQAPLWGLVRTLSLEHPESSPVLIDVGSTGAQAEDERLLAEEILFDCSESIVAFRCGTRYTARLIPYAPRPETAQRLRIEVPGRLEDLHLEDTTRRDPEPHEVEIRVHASGLNFRDVLTALGMFSIRDPRLGAECSGTIVRVGSAVEGWKAGEDVLAVAPFSFQTFVSVRADFVTRKPAEMTFPEAAGVPVAFLTADYGLNRLAGLISGQRILIHAGAGGLGLAAIQLALCAGAEVFATAGSSEKRAFLKKLGIKHIFDSRSLTFRDELLEATGGTGVHVVLNSLAGDFIRASLDTVAQGGCFLEVGKRDIWTEEEVAALRRDIRYFAFDLGAIAMRDPRLIAGMLRELMERFSTGELQPLPTALYSFEDATHAFRTMAQARHIGKIVLGLSSYGRQASVRDLVSQGTVLITGGLGALGVEVARWLAMQGARNVILAGRGAKNAPEHPIVAELQQLGVEVRVERVDVASADQLRGLLDRIRATGRSLQAVFHAAGVVQDSTLAKESWSSFREATAPKIEGAWNLHCLTENDPIRLMVFFSSVASILGSPGQGSYAAGNAFLDALAHHRASRGLATLSVNWGGWTSAGMAARLKTEQIARWTRHGVRLMEPAAALAALKTAIESGQPQVAVTDMNWKQFLNERPAMLREDLFAELQKSEGEAGGRVKAGTSILEMLRTAPAGEQKRILSRHVKECACRVLGLPESYAIQDSIPLQDVGLDSLMALEMRNELSQSIGLALPAGLLFDYPAVEDLTLHLLGVLAASRPSSANQVASRAEASDGDGSIAALQSLSDEEAEQLLIKELDQFRGEKANV